MLQEIVDGVLAVTKESVKTFTYESLNNIARLVNGISAVLLSLLPGKANILEGIQGWELRPSFRGPRFPRWMENGASSFNEFIHDLSLDSDGESTTYSTHGEDDNEEFVCPASPVSASSRLSCSSSFRRRDKRLLRIFRYILSWIIWPVRLFLSIPLILLQTTTHVRARKTSLDKKNNEQSLASSVPPKLVREKDHAVRLTTDRRRGVFEDLHLAVEIFIESFFDNVHKVAHFLLSPSEIWEKVVSCFALHGSGTRGRNEVTVQTAVVGSHDPTLLERNIPFYHGLNTDSRTCKDVITELGYPYESIQVVTSDGYVLLLERIPRRDSRKVVYLQHGILDSSMGWVSNGVVGSPAFAAYDQGYDVFLGNLRGLVSREHIDKKISSRKYWRYSINELGTKDMPAIMEKINEIKTSELGLTRVESVEEDENNQPYKLCAICHSLGGAVMLMYLVTSRLGGKYHRLSRLILLSPAGFHEDSTLAFGMLEKIVLLLGPLLAHIMPGLYIPTRFFRVLMHKLVRDFHNYPALGGLVQTLFSYLVGGDSSNWVGVLGLPHYNIDDMPGLSFHVAIHLAQIKRAKKFRMYDYGSQVANMKAYGTAEPLDLAAHYNLINIPVDLVAGQKDKVIRPSMVRKHYRILKKAHVEVSYNEFEYAHLDFTFSHREELLTYVMSHLLLVSHPEKDRGNQTHRRVWRQKRASTAADSKAHSSPEEEMLGNQCGEIATE